MKIGDLVKWRIGENYRYQLGVVTEVNPRQAKVWFFEDNGYSIMTVINLEVV